MLLKSPAKQSIFWQVPDRPHKEALAEEGEGFDMECVRIVLEGSEGYPGHQSTTTSGGLKADAVDLKLQLEQAALVNAETDLPALRKRLNLAEQELAQEESATAKQRYMRAEEDKELLQRQLNQIEAGMSSQRWLQSEYERLKAALVNSETDLPALRRRVNMAEQELVQAQEESATAKQRYIRAEEDKEVLQRQLNQIEATASSSSQRERRLAARSPVWSGLHALCLLTAGFKAAQQASEAAERSKTQSELPPRGQLDETSLR
eukprot:Skav217902  [mRNA]  locus=scaffold795:125647:131822:+ [translate_table: standard]